MLTEYGRPADCAERSDTERLVYDLLDSLSIEYFRADHDAAETMEACREVEKALGAPICKNLFLTNRQMTNFYLLLMPGGKPFKTKELSSQLGVSRLSFGTAENMERLLGLLPGSVSVMGLMNDKDCEVRLIIDRDLLDAPYIGCHPCVNTSSLKIRADDIVNVFLPAVRHGYTPVVLRGE